MHEYRALGRGDGSNLSEPVGVTAAMAPSGLVRLRVQPYPCHGGPTSVVLEGDREGHNPRERLLGGRGTYEGKPEGLLLWFCGDNCLPRLEQ